MIFQCKYCGKEFQKTHNRQMYCSKECSTKAKKEQDVIHGRRWWKKNGNKYREYKKEYNKKYGRLHRKNYLKRKALELLNGDEKLLEEYIQNNPKTYLIREIECQQLGLGSYSEAMYKCFKRANGRCELTGRKTDDLHIHHINSYNSCIQGRCDLNNLIALDKKVHIEFHRKYGRGNNTQIQFDEFKKEYLNRATLDNWM